MNSCKIGQNNNSLKGLQTITGASSDTSAYVSLARSLSTDPRFKDVRFVLRSNAGRTLVCGLYAFGDFEAVDLERLAQLAGQLARVNRAARFVDYAEAELLAELLAEKLKAAYGWRELQGFEYRPIPRGGFIVLGMLSYALGLKGTRDVDVATDTTRPLVFVDDCVLSGLRFRQELEKAGSRPVILATLVAPAALLGRVAVQDRSFELFCAAELTDLAPDLYGKAYPAWRERWESRQGASVLWTGQPEYVCFSWSEPESSFFNQVTQELEAGFRFVPQEKCLRYRHDGTPRAHVGEIVLHEDGPGPLNAAPDTVALRLDGRRVALADFSGDIDGKVSACYLLEDSAADMWEYMISHGSIEKAARELASIYDMDPLKIGTDVAALSASLLELGLLVSA